MISEDANLCAHSLLHSDIKIKLWQSCPSFPIPIFASNIALLWFLICVIISGLYLQHYSQSTSIIFFTAISNPRKPTPSYSSRLGFILTMVSLFSNFLYNPELRDGVLVDFGLAEVNLHPPAAVSLSVESNLRHKREGSEYTGTCLCAFPPHVRRERIVGSYYSTHMSPGSSIGYPKNDSRPSRRANRAGTRGFRAPEVLFKCTSQTTKIDMWSAGVILLTFLGRRFPFFNAADDVDAMIEMASIFGARRMKAAAAIHGQVFETSIPTIGEKGYSWERLVKWASCVEDLTESEKQATRLLARLMELDPQKRLSAKEALHHEFFLEPIEHDVEWGGYVGDSADSGEDEGDGAEEEVDEVAML